MFISPHKIKFIYHNCEKKWNSYTNYQKTNYKKKPNIHQCNALAQGKNSKLRIKFPLPPPHILFFTSPYGFH